MAQLRWRKLSGARYLVSLSLIGSLTEIASAQSRAPEVPHLVTQGDRHAFIVDGAPFLMLGAQANNSSNYPWALPKVWPVLDRIHANTLEIPVAWQQVEPQEGKFDFSWVQNSARSGART